MKLLDQLLAKAHVVDKTSYRVLARVLLNEAGKVQDVQIKQSSGDSVIDQRAINEIKNAQYTASRLGSRSVRVWHDMVWTCPRQT